MMTFCLMSFASEGIDVERFGKNGDLVPLVTRQLIPEAYFTTHRSHNIASGHNYVAHFEVPKGETVGMRGKRGITERIQPVVGENAMLLSLFNGNDLDIDVVLNATSRKGNGVSNYILRVGAGDVLNVNISSLKRFDDINLISLFPYDAVMDRSIDGELVSSNTLNAVKRFEEPEDQFVAKTGAYCAYRWKFRRLDSAAGSVAAYFKHDVSSTNSSVYMLDVYYPTYADLFHERDGVAYVPNPDCKMDAFYTESPVTGKRLVWSKMLNTLFGNGTGEASEIGWGGPPQFYVRPLF